MTKLITTSAELDRLCRDIEQSSWVALDTEFERVRTFFPRLCLIQIATQDQVACIDPLAKMDLVGLVQVLSSTGPMKILHAARQDIEVLHHGLGILPKPLFDTQIAAALCGHGEQVSYAQLVKSLCGVSLSKQYTRAEWSRRPLSEGEIRYAIDDVRYLGELYRQLHQELGQRGRLDWAEEDFQELASGRSIESGATIAVRKVQAASRRFDRTGQSVAHVLARWREETARRDDRPREWVLPLEAILQIAQERPASHHHICLLSGLSEGSARRWSQEILAAVQRGQREADNYVPLPPPRRPDAQEKALGNRLWQCLQVLCEQGDLPTASVARRDDIRQLAIGDRNLPLLRGWRERFAGAELLALAEAETISRNC